VPLVASDEIHFGEHADVGQLEHDHGAEALHARAEELGRVDRKLRGFVGEKRMGIESTRSTWESMRYTAQTLMPICCSLSTMSRMTETCE
jgi:hypothetical protein